MLVVDAYRGGHRHLTRPTEPFSGRGRAMATGEARPEIDDTEAVKAEWLGRLDSLVDEVDGWARASGWRTRRIGKTVKERRLGTYRVPVLLMEKDTVEVVLNPVARFVPGAGGAVDLYVAARLRRYRQSLFRGRSLGRALRRTARPVGHAERRGDHAPPLLRGDDPRHPRRNGRQCLNVIRSSTV